VRAQRNIVWSVALATAVFCAWPAHADAQYRRGHPIHSRVVVVGGGFYSPFWYGPFYDPWWGLGYPYGPYPPVYPYHLYDAGASVRLEVKPREAEVYVDGYYAGVVDDFDGVFQRLSVQPGEHELELYLDGYRAVKQQIYVTPRNTFKVKYDMVRLASGEQAEPRPQPVNPPPQQAGGQPPMPPGQAPPPRPPAARRAPPAAPNAPLAAQPAAYGSLAIRVQPADAEVLVDGERWRGPEAQDRLVIEVPEGRHTIEIQKPGYRTYVTDVQVRSGETTTLNVSLRTQNEE
jgi:hypothetical protein